LFTKVEKYQRDKNRTIKEQGWLKMEKISNDELEKLSSTFHGE